MTHIAVIARAQDSGTAEPTTPCGRCRQFINEFAHVAEEDIEVICANTAKDRILVARISELLPLGFGPRDVGLSLDAYR